MIWTCAEEGQRLYLRKDAEDGRARQEAQKTKEDLRSGGARKGGYRIQDEGNSRRRK